MSKILLIEYMECNMIKTAFIDTDAFYMFMNGVLTNFDRTVSSVRKIIICDKIADFDYKKMHDIIDSMMKKFNYSYEYINKNDGLFLRINVYKDSLYVECHTIPLDKRKLLIETMAEVATYIRRFIR